MKLLDLPQELFDEVVAHYVASAGVLQAWKMRRLCSKFRTSTRCAIACSVLLFASLFVEQHTWRHA